MTIPHETIQKNSTKRSTHTISLKSLSLPKHTSLKRPRACKQIHAGELRAPDEPEPVSELAYRREVRMGQAGQPMYADHQDTPTRSDERRHARRHLHEMPGRHAAPRHDLPQGAVQGAHRLRGLRADLLQLRVVREELLARDMPEQRERATDKGRHRPGTMRRAHRDRVPAVAHVPRVHQQPALHVVLVERPGPVQAPLESARGESFGSTVNIG